MIAYEILLMLDPEVGDDRGAEIVQRIRESVEKSGGTWGNQEPWGRRRLAYEIDHKGEGVYHLLTFDCTPETLEEISRVLKITEGVMRHLGVRRIVGLRSPGAPPPFEAVTAPAYAGGNTRSRSRDDEEE
ncbi:MAG: 30S ribosomal protein S6 [Gaiellaceae bacterium]